MKKILGIIPARGGSKGIPDKNLKALAGKPLLQYTYESAVASTTIDRIVLSSDDSEIMDVARDLGCEVPFPDSVRSRVRILLLRRVDLFLLIDLEREQSLSVRTAIANRPEVSVPRQVHSPLIFRQLLPYFPQKHPRQQRARLRVPRLL